MQQGIQEHISALLMDSSSVVKRAILHDISYLCIFLGRQKTNDVLLSHMITYLNDRDWLLRYAFFESIVDVAACAGGRSLDEYILPLMIQALSGVSFLSQRILQARLISSFLVRCGRNSGHQSIGFLDQPMHIGSVPEDAYLGVDERDVGFLVPPQHLDKTRCRLLHCIGRQTSAGK